ncbi:hypothetical protein AWB82_04066 [Caballeronia glebae]|jgi:hypothetical protein|uniref:Uncharacterized protein n=1 Tax=Caballeronia glebae TaxID=1777143 RepID=A0A158BGQ0_9BURK|nr:hypothetical protein AWB82_04066 [Caballeronia glebae]
MDRVVAGVILAAALRTTCLASAFAIVAHSPRRRFTIDGAFRASSRTPRAGAVHQLIQLPPSTLIVCAVM